MSGGGRETSRPRKTGLTIHATVLVQDEVSQDVRPHDLLVVSEVEVKEVRVLRFDKGVCFGVLPELELPARFWRVQCQARRSSRVPCRPHRETSQSDLVDKSRNDLDGALGGRREVDEIKVVALAEDGSRVRGRDQVGRSEHEEGYRPPREEEDGHREQS